MLDEFFIVVNANNFRTFLTVKLGATKGPQLSHKHPKVNSNK